MTSHGTFEPGCAACRGADLWSGPHPMRAMHIPAERADGTGPQFG